VEELSRRWDSKVGVSAILAFKMVFGDTNDTMSYPTLSNSTEVLKFSKLMSPHAAHFAIEKQLGVKLGGVPAPPYP
jgi:hypothetical protein